MEAVACGTPVVVADIDGLSEAAGPAGLVVPAGDAGALAAALRRLHAQPTLLAGLRAAALVQRATYASWEDVAARWSDVLGIG
jgi:glycosyltransferase involved in cell wall biosynthesis